jgi:hypothetical protein
MNIGFEDSRVFKAFHWILDLTIPEFFLFLAAARSEQEV